MRLHFQTYGEGPPLIILHGLLGSLENWHPISQRLGRYYRVLAVDQRNHGRSPHDAQMSYPLMAADLDVFMDVESVSRACVLGHSMGGKTAMQFALQHGSRVERLIVVDIAPRAYTSRHVRILEGLLALELATCKERREMEDRLAAYVPDLAVRQFLLKNVERDAAGAFRWRIGLREIAASYHRLSEPIGSEKAFDGPVLFIRGETSDYLGEEDMPMIRQLFPAATLRTIAGAGHLVHVERQAAFLEAVMEFLGSGRAKGGPRNVAG